MPRLSFDVFDEDLQFPMDTLDKIVDQNGYVLRPSRLFEPTSQGQDNNWTFFRDLVVFASKSTL